MNEDTEARLFRANRKLVNESLSATKGCYFIGCKNPTIRAHSISNKRLLLKLSDNGDVMYFNKNSSDWGSLVKTGRGTASTFSGFCGVHDKIFFPIDNEDYVTGNKEQNYLFAMRAAAKEFTTRRAMSHAVDTRINTNESQEFAFDSLGLAMMGSFQKGFDIGLEDQKVTRGIFIDTYMKNKYMVIDTAVIEINEELPIAVSSTFNLELAYDGTLINDLSPAGYSQRMKPCFLTIFPQNGKTYALISYLRKDRGPYKFLQELNGLSDGEKKVVLSNLVTSYTENFTAEPNYWNSLNEDTKTRYSKVYGNSFKTLRAPLIADSTFSLFPSDQ